MFDRICKFYIISLSGAFFFAILDTFRRMATGLAAVCFSFRSSTHSLIQI
eukprot:COSAG03_NODE_1328_length_4314_cov_42.348517_3_plen_50_part_00